MLLIVTGEARLDVRLVGYRPPCGCRRDAMSSNRTIVGAWTVLHDGFGYRVFECEGCGAAWTGDAVALDRDIYGEPVTGPRRRARGCTDRVPCLTFDCKHPRHRGSPVTPWCRGHGPDEFDADGEWCDDCWAREARATGAIQ